MNFEYRIIGKVGFLLIIIGFFMPWLSGTGWVAFVTQENGFQIADGMIGLGQLIGYGAAIAVGRLMYVWFAFALAGVATGILLLLKKNVPAIVDWFIVVVCFAASLVAIYMLHEEADMTIHAGPYVILAGSMIVSITQAISTIGKEKI